MQSSKIIGILIEDIRIAHHTESAYVIEQELTRLGYTCITLSTGPRLEQKMAYIRILEQRRVEGVILMGSMFGIKEIQDCMETYLPHIPVALVNGCMDLLQAYSVLVDEENGVGDCVRLLARKGRCNLAFVQDLDTPSNRNKMNGFVRAMEQSGMKCEKTQIVETDPGSGDGTPVLTIERGRQAAARILDEHPETDGIIFSVDLLAIGGLEELKARGIDVPGQIAVIGVDNTLYGRICTPKLTTLDHKLVDVSRTAAEMLLRALDKKEGPHKLMLFPEIIERETT
ncbi:MAG: LacI family DNA-binding transcriptional regulator [Lachnospiraceae bacterium]